MISPASVKQVMDRADIVDVIGQFLRLKKRGTNYQANCPFHNEKTPSFNVSPSKGIYKCFGCGKAGNVVTFIQEHEKLTYPEAMHWLADYYKIKLDETERSPEQQQHQLAEEALRILNEYAAGFFQETLAKSEEGQIIGQSYFKQRGFRKEIIDKFRLGYNPETGDFFYRAAINKGYRAELLEKAGLVKNRNDMFYDVYRGRVIFPIQSMTGRILGFGARILKSNEKAPKYINSPENELYNKSKVLYGMYQSRQAIGKQDECLLVEGYTDVISLHQGGVENVVSSSGTSLTEDQLRLIGQLTKNLTILYDGDSAGIKAALRGLDMALSQSFNVQLVLLPEGEDPDSYVQKVGAAKFHEYIKDHKQDVINFRLHVGLKDVGTDPVKKSKLVNEIAESISRINKAEDFSLQGHYIREASQKLNVEETGLINLVNKYIRERVENDQKNTRKADNDYIPPEAMPGPDMYPGEEEAVAKVTTADELQEWQLVRVLIEYGNFEYEGHENVAKLIEDRVDPELLHTPLAQQIFREYLQYLHENGKTPDTQYFVNHHDSSTRTKMANLLHGNVEISKGWKDKLNIEQLTPLLVYRRDVDSSLEYFELKKALKLLEELTQQIPLENDPARLNILLESHLQLKKLIRDITHTHKPTVYNSNKVKF